MRILLFAALAFSVPLLYMDNPVMGGVVPWGVMLVLSVLPGWRSLFGYISVALHIVQLGGYGVLLWLLASWLASWIRRIKPGRRAFVIGVVIALVVSIAFLPLYSLGHDRQQGESALALYVELLIEKPFKFK